MPLCGIRNLSRGFGLSFLSFPCISTAQRFADASASSLSAIDVSECHAHFLIVHPTWEDTLCRDAIRRGNASSQETNPLHVVPTWSCCLCEYKASPAHLHMSTFILADVPLSDSVSVISVLAAEHCPHRAVRIMLSRASEDMCYDSLLASSSSTHLASFTPVSNRQTECKQLKQCCFSRKLLSILDGSVEQSHRCYEHQTTFLA